MRFDVVANEQGLPSASVFGVTQDRRGFLWIATGNGLARYDGYATRVFRYARNAENSLAMNSMVGLIPGRDGVLWLATIGEGWTGSTRGLSASRTTGMTRLIRAV